MRSTSFRFSNKSGFSLFELIITLAVISVIAAIGAPRLNLHRFRLDASVRTIQTTLQQAEREAVRRQHDTVVGFDATGRRIRLLDDVNNNGAGDNTERVTWKQLDDGIRFANPPAGFGSGAAVSVTGGSLSTIDGYPSVIFRRDGAASSDLQVFITSSRAQNGDFRLLSVTRSTGRVDWYRYGSGWTRGSI